MGTELLLSAGAPSVLSLPSDSSSGATSHTRNAAQGRCEKQQNGSTHGRRYQTTVGMFPDNVLLEIFDFYHKNHDYTRNPVWEWHLLVHVCKAWRQIVCSSPRRLDLKILCTYGTPVRGNLGLTMKTTSFMHSSTAIVYVVSSFPLAYNGTRGRRSLTQRCSSHSRF
ncbi:hypothetical protein EDB92DRAFT_261479 [Lactarius akahatsu]|uniref:F-box domain-containing protein n=1 Tax=Lactarius akahatsu TaxID=416441 RepID=A0AAD4LBZ4_9AGAM|nr:hypothetical protein EDB92DRAFT_261479 [Lactarius akahatsu]